MTASKFPEAQEALILKPCEEGAPVAQICREAGIDQPTKFNWKKRSIISWKRCAD
ncbi:transposase [Anianabacter salinae]|uniref:transposase n=1 Tax=Anianabacter salinae TaxID=2851023 RepID=UPI00389922BA